MFIEEQIMEKNNLVINQTHGGQFGTIPKRVPVDDIQWLETNTLGKTLITPDELAKIYGERDFNFYLILTLLTLGFVCGILCLYICFCMWAMKGNMDLPLPGGGMQKTNTLKFVNPLKNSSILSYIRCKFNVAPPPGQGQQAHHPSVGNASNSLNQSERRPEAGGDTTTCRAKAAAKIPAISHNQPPVEPLESANFNPTPTNPVGHNIQLQQDFSDIAANHTGYTTTSTGKLFESKAKGLHDSFKQFKQFRYDHQMDDEPEQVVFDAFDLQTGHY